MPVVIGPNPPNFRVADNSATIAKMEAAFPTVPKAKPAAATMMTSEHTRPQIDQALDVLDKTARKMGILS